MPPRQRSTTPWFATSRCVVVLLAFGAPTAGRSDDERVAFNRDVRPILAAACVGCHGPDEHRREADLRLDVDEGIEQVFRGGALDNAAAWARITSEDADQRMPPVDAERQLTGDEIAVLRAWIEQGAPWQRHWAFIRPQRSPLSKQSAATDRVDVHPIDQFLDRRRQASGLSAAARADGARLLRRVTFDLTGLPPTLAEIDEFLSDQRPNAYERVVDRLLASPHFGERMAVAWLDAARYGDTSVFHGDGPRDMWAWRDWVINAYNNNKPFDDFTVEQLAGDLIPEATTEQRIASAFNRNNATTDEGGAIAEEFRVEYAVDRVKTTSMVWLGLTMECAQCHDHKYDPISQEDYYRFYAYFNQSADPGMQTRKGNTAPTVDVPNYQAQARLATVQQQLRRVEADLAARRLAAESDFQAWTAAATEHARLQQPPPSGLLVHVGFDEGQGDVASDSVDATRQGMLVGAPQWTTGKIGGALRCDAERFVKLGDLASFERTDAFSYGGWLKPAATGSGAVIARMNDGNAHRGFDLHLADGKVQVHLIHRWPDNSIKVVTQQQLVGDQWQHVFVTYDGSSRAAGVQIYVDGQIWPGESEQDCLTETIGAVAPLHIGRRMPGEPLVGEVDEVRIYGRKLSSDEVKAVFETTAADPILAEEPAARSEADVQVLRDYYFENHDGLHQKVAAELHALRAEEAAAEEPRGTVMVMGDVEEPRMTYILARGDYASPQEDRPVAPGIPEALGNLPSSAPANRLGLARWIASPTNPLTARVAVNRYWLMLFGAGLVESAEDFGLQGAWPSHPELLDWLATDFIESGWDVKRMIKQIVMSAAYQQSSRVSRDLFELDPQNRLLSRGPRFRLQGEFIRDAALAAGGLLVNQVGGPSVKPYQPEGLWNEVSIDTSLRFSQDHGENLYRRSLYIYWKRSAPPPSMAIFDAPSREKCTIRRSRTNTPLQALVTLNDPQFVEAARALAQRVLLAGRSDSDSDADRMIDDSIAMAYRLATGVRPSAAALAVLRQSYRTELAVFQAVPARAAALLKVGESPCDDTLNPAEHAAMTIVAGMILNLDEMLTRG